MRLVLDNDGPGSYSDILKYMETVIRENCVMREGAMVTAVREDKETRLARAMLTSVLSRLGVDRSELPQENWREGKTDAELHAMRAHPDFEYATTEGQRKQWDDVDTPPATEEGDPDPTWERNVDAGRDGWERFDYTEESYWRRRKHQS